MTERMIENRIRRLQEIEAQQKDLEAQAEAIRTEIKDDMENRGVDELKIKDFIVCLYITVKMYPCPEAWIPGVRDMIQRVWSKDTIPHLMDHCLQVYSLNAESIHILPAWICNSPVLSG